MSGVELERKERRWKIKDEQSERNDPRSFLFCLVYGVLVPCLHSVVPQIDRCKDTVNASSTTPQLRICAPKQQYDGKMGGWVTDPVASQPSQPARSALGNGWKVWLLPHTAFILLLCSCSFFSWCLSLSLFLCSPVSPPVLRAIWGACTCSICVLCFFFYLSFSVFALTHLVHVNDR